MAWIDDIDVLNDAASAGDWSASGFDTPTLNDSAATTPIYVEGSACMWWPLKKGTSNGYTYTSTISGTPTLTGRICVGFLNYPFADIDLIPINSIFMRLSSATGFTTNYLQWDAKAQVTSPENVPISGHTPVIGYEDGATETGTFSGNCESIGWVASTGGTADGKQGGFDWFFVVSYFGAHSASLVESYFSGMYDEYYDNSASLPGQTSRPTGVLSQAGDFFQTNVNFQMGHGTSDTNNIVVTETAKTIFFNNLHVNHELGYVFVNPASTHEIRLTLTDCVHFWNDQNTTAEIFTDATNADDFKITGCAFSNGGKITLPPDNVDRWVRSTKFSSCQSGTASDGEFTNNILNDCLAMTVSGDADFTGTQVLEASVGADASALVWNGAFDPDGNLDDMVFSKGANAHHAIEFGTASPLTMTLTNIDFQNFSGTNGLSNSTLHVKRTTGTVTINLSGCTGNISYKSAGATVSLVAGAVTVKVTAQTETGTAIASAFVHVRASDGTGPLPYQESVTITRSTTTATVTHTGHGMASNDKVLLAGITDKTEDNTVQQITVTGTNTYTYTTTDSGSTSYTGTIISTFVALNGLTDVNGEISTSRVYSANQPVFGSARKSSTPPYYKQGTISTTIDSSAGLDFTAVMVSDE